MSPAHDERDRILAAMDRVLAGQPQRSNGALTIVALAEEAEVPRNALTQRHTDLKNAFYEKVRARGGIPDNERRLRQQIRKLKELRAADAEELRQLREDNEALVGALHQAAVENRLLRQRATEQHRNVRVLPSSAAGGQHGPPLSVQGSSAHISSPDIGVRKSGPVAEE